MSPEPEYFSQQVTDARRWFLAFPDGAEEGLVVVSVGCERCLPDYVVERAGFDFECVEFVAEGQGTLQLGGQTHALQAGSAFAYGPGVPHRIENTSRQPMLKYFLDCGGRDAERLFANSSVSRGSHVQVGEVEEVAEVLELLIRNAMLESAFSARICGTLVETLLLKITEKTLTEPTGGSRSRQTYLRVRRHMEQHFLRLQTMGEVARETGLDPAYLSRTFRKYHGSSPYRYLLRLRMKHAASLLLNQGILVKEVASFMGFDDPFHFSRTFKSVHGKSPEQFVRRFSRK